MPYRHVVAGLTLAGVVTLLACRGLVSLDVASSTMPRTAWGDPDLQGVWRYEGAIPLERPRQLEGRASLTAAGSCRAGTRRKGAGGQATRGTRGRCRRPPVGGRVADSRERVQQLLAGPRPAATDLEPHVAHRGSARRSTAIHPRREEGGSAFRRPLRSRPVRVVSGSGYWRTLPDRRRDGHDVAGTQRRPQPNRAESWIRHDPSRGIPRPPCHPGRSRTRAQRVCA